MSDRRLVVAITGASGAPYAVRLLEHLARAEVRIDLIVSTYGKRLLFDELDIRSVDPDALTGGRGDLVTLHNDQDVGAPPASGSYPHDGMVVVPCSGNTLARISTGVVDNLVQRAAMVCLKERRRLVLAHRETPLSLVEIENMRAATAAGAVILPLTPGFYLLPESIDDLLDFMVARILDLFDVPHEIDSRWDEQLRRRRAERRAERSGD